MLEEQPESVSSGRVIEEIAGEAPGWSSKTGKIERRHRGTSGRARRRRSGEAQRCGQGTAPGFRRAARWRRWSARRRPAKRWLHEIKFDGYRLQARIDAGKVKLLTRSGLDWTAKFGNELAAALRALPVGPGAHRWRAGGRKRQWRVRLLGSAGRH